MRQVVLDTNVLISAIVFGGKPREVLQAVLSGQVRLILSDILIEELIGVLEGPKFRYPREATRIIEERLRDLAKIVTPHLTIDRIVSDPDDNRVLECAVAGEADLIISGDSDLVTVGEFRGIPIWTPADFLKRL